MSYVSDGLFNWILAYFFTSCTASSKDLDGGDAILRTKEHREALLRAFNADVLWTEYGINASVVVSVHFSLIQTI